MPIDPIQQYHQVYITNTNVQLGATYGIAKRSTNLYESGIEAAAAFINAHVDEIGVDFCVIINN